MSDDKKFLTSSNIEVPEYSKPIEVDLPPPGKFPYIRGPYPSMYRGRKWTMRQYSGFSTAVETNKRFLMLLEKGQSGLSVAFDLPTQMGYDSDDTMAMGEVGKVGVAIDTVEDMKLLFNGINLSKVSTSMTINAPAMVLLAMYIVVAEESGVDSREIMGTIQNDILKEYTARGTYIFPPQPSMRLITDIFEYCSKKHPRFNTISISGYHIREAGSTAVQEIAFTLANAREYVRAALSKGLEIDSFAKRLSFFFNASSNLLEEVAKFRATRRMWAHMMRDEFGAKDKKSMMLRFHTQTSGASLTAQQPYNNVVRVTLQALSAVLGGTQSLHTNAMDEALALPTEESVTLALKTQQVISEETGVADTADPLGGSWFVENLTDQLEEKAWELIKEVEEIGVLQAISDGVIQSKIHESAYEHERLMEKGERIVVGVNKFVEEDTKVPDLMRIDDKVVNAQIDTLQKVREKRDESKVSSALNAMVSAARSEENLFPHVIEAVRARASLGEIVKSLKKEFGTYKPTFTL